MRTCTCVLITNGNMMSMLALGEWLLRYGSGILKIYVTYRLPSAKSNLRGVLDMLLHSGWSYTYAKLWANRLAPVWLHRRALPASVAEFAELCGLEAPVEAVASVNSDEVVGEIRTLAPQYLMSFSATQRFKEPLIDVPSRGAVNTHYGALPAYAGLSPYYWHLHHKEARFGVTLHRIVPKLDAGPIIEQTVGSMAGATTALDVLCRMADCVSPMLNRFFAGRTTLEQARPQPAEGRSYFRHPTRKQVREFKAAGFRMMDAAARKRVFERVAELAVKARASNPRPVRDDRSGHARPPGVDQSISR